MAQFSDLSGELIIHFCSFLSQVDLLNLSVTSKRMHEWSESELYREYRNPCILHHGRRVNRRHIILFIKRLITRPALKRYVRVVDLHAWKAVNTADTWEDGDGEDVDLVASRGTQEQNTYAVLVEAALNAGVITQTFSYNSVFGKDGNTNSEYDEKFCRLLRASVPDAYVVLLLALLPNVRNIILRSAPGSEAYLPWQAAHNFHGLRSIVAAGDAEDNGWPLSFLTQPLQSAKLDRLVAYRACSWSDNASYSSPLDLQPQSLNLQHIHLDSCAFTLPDIKSLLEACCTLSTFNYSAGGSLYAGPSNFTISELMEVLEPHKATLKELRLDMSSKWDYDDEDWGHIIDLTEYNSLEKLHTRADMWGLTEPEQLPQEGVMKFLRTAFKRLDHEHILNRLPSSLKEFSIIDEKLEAFLHVEDIIHTHSEHLPDLQKVTVIMPQKIKNARARTLMHLKSTPALKYELKKLNPGHHSLTGYKHLWAEGRDALGEAGYPYKEAGRLRFRGGRYAYYPA